MPACFMELAIYRVDNPSSNSHINTVEVMAVLRMKKKCMTLQDYVYSSGP